MSKPCKRSQISGGPWSRARDADRLGLVVAGALGTDVRRSARLGGGDVAESYRLTLGDGRTVFAKTHRDPPPGFFTTEAIGLAWLRRPGVVAVPEVLAVSDGDADHPAFVVLEWIDEGRPTSNTETDLGASLAALHRAGAPCFGREDRRTTGSRALPNDPCDSWVEFYATRRLEPLARLATDRRALPSESLGLLERGDRHVSTISVVPKTTGATPRRPVGRQPARRPPRPLVADRPGCPRRSP